jgi:hypothetical protein
MRKTVMPAKKNKNMLRVVKTFYALCFIYTPLLMVLIMPRLIVLIPRNGAVNSVLKKKALVEKLKASLVIARKESRSGLKIPKPKGRADKPR